MKRLLISCGMLADELNKACEGEQNLPEIMELPRGMHENPGNLKENLQMLINEHQNVDEIVLTYGLCGNSTLELKSQKTRLVLPRFDDCISQLLYKEAEGRKCRSKIKTGHLYLTGGWIKDKKSVMGQCSEIMEMYGEDGYSIIEQIYGGYHTVSVIDTSAFDLKRADKNAEKIKKYLKVKTEHISGSYDILKRIISGDYDENFILLNPGEVVEEKMFRFNGE